MRHSKVLAAVSKLGMHRDENIGFGACLVLSQPIGLQPNGAHIRAHHLRIPMMARYQFDHGVLPSSSPPPRNTAIPLVGNRRVFLWEKESPFLEKKWPSAFSLMEEKCLENWARTMSRCIKNKQTDKHSSSYSR